jgi:hypothetical protein
MPVYADFSLAEHEEITFSAGTHRELVRMHWHDMLRIVNPTIAELTYHSGSASRTYTQRLLAPDCHDVRACAKNRWLALHVADSRE